MMVTAYQLRDKWKREYEVILQSSGAKRSIKRKQALSITKQDVYNL